MIDKTLFSFEKIDDICKIEILTHLATAPVTVKFKEAIDELINKNKCKKILFDLSRVEFVDSSFIGAIVYAYKILNKINGRVCCVIKTASVNDRFVISQIDKLFNIASTIDEAMKYLKNL